MRGKANKNESPRITVLESYAFVFLYPHLSPLPARERKGCSSSLLNLEHGEKACR